MVYFTPCPRARAIGMAYLWNGLLAIPNEPVCDFYDLRYFLSPMASALVFYQGLLPEQCRGKMGAIL